MTNYLSSSMSEELGSRADQSSCWLPDSTSFVSVSTLEVALRSARRRPRPAKSTEAVMEFVEAEVARVLAADPTVEAARQRAIRRAGRSSSRRLAGAEMIATH